MGQARRTLSREVKAAYREMEHGLEQLGRSIADIQSGVRRGERQIEADARERIRELRRDAKGRLTHLQARRREVAQTLRRLSGAAGGSWRDVKRGGDRVLADARSMAEAVVRRFRRALRG